MPKLTQEQKYIQEAIACVVQVQSKHATNANMWIQSDGALEWTKKSYEKYELLQNLVNFLTGLLEGNCD
jgi:hypothetical protein